MWEWRPPVATFSAGATTIARIAGPSSGTRICRGLLAVSAARRRASVTSAPAVRARRARGSLIARDSAIADIRVAPCRGWASGCFAERARELEVDVVQIGHAGRDLRSADLCLLDRGQRLGGSVA